MCTVPGCKNECTPGRRYCRVCYLQRKRNQFHEQYAINGRYMYQLECSACHKPFKAWRFTQILCPKCYQESLIPSPPTSIYTRVKQNGYKLNHRETAEVFLNRKLTSDEIVHHMNTDASNPNPYNLGVIDKNNHGRLHLYLRQQRVIAEKSGIIKTEEEWQKLATILTNNWVGINRVYLEKLIDDDLL